MDHAGEGWSLLLRLAAASTAPPMATMIADCREQGLDDLSQQVIDVMAVRNCRVAVRARNFATNV